VAVRALLAHFAQRSEEWDWFSWNGIRDGSEAHAALSAVPQFEWNRELTDYVLPLPSSWDEFRSSRSRNIKESMRKCYNSLKRDGHSFEFRVVTQGDALRSAVERLFELHALRAGLSDGVKHEDVFATPQSRRLLLDLAGRPSEALAVRAFQLEIAGRVVATRLGFLVGDELYLYFSGYEPAWAPYSVMTTTVAEALKWAIAQGFRQVNLSPGTDVSKTRWGASTVKTHDGVLLSPTVRGKVAFGMLTELHELSRPGTLLGRVIDLARRQG
jgi:CelD/BcsL family acetyltransferase involved in cellulose biosynthesis